MRLDPLKVFIGLISKIKPYHWGTITWLLLPFRNERRWQEGRKEEKQYTDTRSHQGLDQGTGSIPTHIASRCHSCTIDAPKSTANTITYQLPACRDLLFRWVEIFVLVDISIRTSSVNSKAHEQNHGARPQWTWEVLSQPFKSVWHLVLIRSLITLSNNSLRQ